MMVRRHRHDEDGIQVQLHFPVAKLVQLGALPRGAERSARRSGQIATDRIDELLATRGIRAAGWHHVQPVYAERCEALEKRAIDAAARGHADLQRA
ncbi:MAG: hypothetical protein ABW020_00915, partial [Candidatus Rokuibacteriota bacterium]